MSWREKYRKGIRTLKIPHDTMENLRKKGRKFKEADDYIYKKFKKGFPPRF